ncbi:hypothetical protein UB31_11675 [Bradyrhizobium sp. LTSP849]|uniref:hypothetical protein n=1 Tax=Bradyrhizobium sp. LTSP849 TaxID=1615890 RepID=UPI0005DF7283|nr:hypothetical protein [Bradyrhizobium sp. LTSP849]KJC50889.1 hypothetical protein UB31_11675 [Bradyrhizobium sp. LTSP849]
MADDAVLGTLAAELRFDMQSELTRQNGGYPIADATHMSAAWLAYKQSISSDYDVLIQRSARTFQIKPPIYHCFVASAEVNAGAHHDPVAEDYRLSFERAARRDGRFGAVWRRPGCG